MPGDKIELKRFKISPWFPRKPGLYWTYDAAKARKKAIENHIEKIERNFVVFDTYGKTLMYELGGVGSVNFKKNRDEILLTATASGNTHCGIPIITSKVIWDEINAEIETGREFEISLYGTVEEMPNEYDTNLLRSPGIPKIGIKVRSILNIDFKTQSFLQNIKRNIKITPWTIFESNRSNYPYGFTFVTHNLYEDDMNKSVNWMLDYIHEHDGSIILTDFDENLNSLGAMFPLENCMSGEVTSSNIFGYCQRIYHMYKRS